MVGGVEMLLIRLSHTEESCDGVAPEKTHKGRWRNQKEVTLQKCHKPEQEFSISFHEMKSCNVKSNY